MATPLNAEKKMLYFQAHDNYDNQQQVHSLL